MGYGYGLMEPAGQTMVLDGVTYIRHSNGGGCVPSNQDEFDPNRVYVSENAWVGPCVIVTNKAKIHGGEFRGGLFTLWGKTYYSTDDADDR